MSRKEDQLNLAIQSVMERMAAYGPEAEEYPMLVEHLEKLTALKQKKRWRIDPNTALLVAGNLLGILIIVVVEQNAVWRSKATDFVTKTKHP